MKYFLDTEFLEGKQKEHFPLTFFRKETNPTIDLISIGNEHNALDDAKAIEIIFQTKTKNEIKDLYANAILTEIKLMKNDNRN
jgi:hypothetical protein